MEAIRVLIALIVFLVPFILVGTIESREAYDRCIHAGSADVYTDMDVTLLEEHCNGNNPLY